MPINPRSARRAAAFASTAVLALALVACVAEPDGSDAPASSVSLAATALPTPGRTIDATPTAAPDLTGYRIAVVVGDESEASQTLLTAARDVAASSGAELVEFPAAAAGEDPVGDAFAEAVGAESDLIVGLGEGVVPVFDFETGKILDQEVLLIGAQLAEPTANVTSVIWPGATSRDTADDDGVTVDRGVDALGAGIASIRDGVSGVVLSLD
ncbi:hypothetical protein [Labedella endophytica]|uniref:BMP family ABC transporter substrate-binding protein n=1 Tax=Labedella endophytica TaxID=1523160 RepID=A0A433JU83_9MICO|nr:hypothetical protein [Labedella endophytica]RUR01738.1 hypothetical protein ELQ94_09775 [Labedella endophytica]